MHCFLTFPIWFSNQLYQCCLHYHGTFARTQADWQAWHVRADKKLLLHLVAQLQEAVGRILENAGFGCLGIRCDHGSQAASIKVLQDASSIGHWEEVDTPGYQIAVYKITLAAHLTV